MLISWFRSRRHHRTSRRLNKFHRRFLVEPLEDRQMLSTLYVTTSDDNGSNTNPLAGSLRAQILSAELRQQAPTPRSTSRLPAAGCRRSSLRLDCRQSRIR